MSGEPREVPAATSFQKQCIGECQRTIKNLGYGQVVFEERGERELYYETEIQLADSKILKIYVYADGAEFSINDEWTRFEKYDYRSLNDLINDFSKKLSDQLAAFNR